VAGHRAGLYRRLLSLLALSALATQLTTSYQAQSFALGGVVATRLLPALLLGPIAGVLADSSTGAS